MDEQKTGWDKIAEQERKNLSREQTSKNVENAAEVTSYVGWIVFLIVVIVVVVIFFGAGGVDLIF